MTSIKSLMQHITLNAYLIYIKMKILLCLDLRFMQPVSSVSMRQSLKSLISKCKNLELIY